eukprot:Colp12_sorted_trinity150504_noHs@15024
MAKGGVEGCGPSFIKFFMIFVNFLFFVAGGAIFGLGIYIIVQYNNNFKDVVSTTNVPTIIFILIGLFILIIGFSGCCGALRENRCLLHTYFALVLIVCLFQVAIGIFAFVERSKVEGWVNDGFRDTLKYYNNTPASRSKGLNGETQSIDSFQQYFSCCGQNGTSDYLALPDQALPNPPLSCYPDKNQANPVFTQGCVAASKDDLKKYMVYVGAILFGIAGLEIIGLIFSFSLARTIKNSYSA